jgi:hypothetical protein
LWKKKDLEVLKDLHVFRPSEREKAFLMPSLCPHVYVCIYVRMDGWMDVRLVGASMVERIKFTFSIYEFIHHRSVSSEYEYYGSKINGLSDRP